MLRFISSSRYSLHATPNVVGHNWDMVPNLQKIEHGCFLVCECSSETSVTIHKTTRQYIPKESKLHSHRQENLKSCVTVRFEVLTAAFVKSSIFWDITPCSPLKVNRRFGGTCRLHI
jgi:hypothetical protein